MRLYVHASLVDRGERGVELCSPYGTALLSFEGVRRRVELDAARVVLSQVRAEHGDADIEVEVELTWKNQDG